MPLALNQGSCNIGIIISRDKLVEIIIEKAVAMLLSQCSCCTLPMPER